MSVGRETPGPALPPARQKSIKRWAFSSGAAAGVLLLLVVGDPLYNHWLARATAGDLAPLTRGQMLRLSFMTQPRFWVALVFAALAPGQYSLAGAAECTQALSLGALGRKTAAQLGSSASSTILRSGAARVVASDHSHTSATRPEQPSLYITSQLAVGSETVL